MMYTEVADYLAIRAHVGHRTYASVGVHSVITDSTVIARGAVTLVDIDVA